MNPGVHPGTWAIYGLLTLMALASLAPFAWMLLASVLPAGSAVDFARWSWPPTLTATHYAALFGRLDLGRYFLNSMAIAGGVTLISLFINSAAGYALAKLRFRGREYLLRGLAAALIIPGQLGMLPLFLLLKELGLVNTYVGAAIPGLASVFGILLIRQYALSISDELLDAARVDGAGELRIYWSVLLPLARPILATLAVFTFLGTWNDFMWPLIVLTDESRYTLPVALANLAGEHALDVELMMAGAVITVLPVVLLFLLLQRHYIEGIMRGAVKE